MKYEIDCVQSPVESTALPGCKYGMKECGCANQGYSECRGVGYYGGNQDDEDDDPYLAMVGRASERREARKMGCLYAIIGFLGLSLLLVLSLAAGK